MEQKAVSATPASGEELACLDGVIGAAAETTIPVTDPGLLRGDGVFEVVRVYEGRPFALGDHLDRMERSLAALRLGRELPRADFERESAELLAERGAGFDGGIRFVLTAGGHRLLITEPLPEHKERIRLGFVTYSPSRVLDGVKSLSYAANMLAGRIARERGFDDALFVSPHGRVLEATISSLFWVDQDGVLSTPPLGEHILASITRQMVLDLLEVEERPCTTDELLAAREAFLAGTTKEVQPIAAIEEREFDAVGEQTAAAATAMRAYVEDALAKEDSG